MQRLVGSARVGKSNLQWGCKAVNLAKRQSGEASNKQGVGTQQASSRSVKLVEEASRKRKLGTTVRSEWCK